MEKKVWNKHAIYFSFFSLWSLLYFLVCKFLLLPCTDLTVMKVTALSRHFVHTFSAPREFNAALACTRTTLLTLEWYRSLVAITTSVGTIIVELCTSLIVNSELKKLTWNLWQENYLHYVIIIAIFFNLFIVRVKRKCPLNTSL